MYHDVIEAQSIHILQHEDGKKQVFYWNRDMKERECVGRVITVVLEAKHKYWTVMSGNWVDFNFARTYKFFLEVEREYMRIKEMKI